MFITSFGEQNITYKCCSNFLIHLCFSYLVLGSTPDIRRVLSLILLFLSGTTCSQ
ncbi:hypothetical protein GPS46_16395 [Acinetobacter haemolyticus]|nr:hypothetical protein [Acinetobacter haemolyticus]NAR94201.1 hypothetical protein [Acinetobacter haemolyticus]